MINVDKRILAEVGGGLAALVGGFFIGRSLVIYAGKKKRLGFDEAGDVWTEHEVEDEIKKKEVDLNKVQEILDADLTGTMTAQSAKEKVIENEIKQELEYLTSLGNKLRNYYKVKIAEEIKEKEAEKAAKKAKKEAAKKK